MENRERSIKHDTDYYILFMRNILLDQHEEQECRRSDKKGHFYKLEPSGDNWIIQERNRESWIYHFWLGEGERQNQKGPKAERGDKKGGRGISFSFTRYLWHSCGWLLKLSKARGWGHNIFLPCWSVAKFQLLPPFSFAWYVTSLWLLWGRVCSEIYLPISLLKGMFKMGVAEF